MYTGDQEKASEVTTSNIACQLCRRRKIRCGRELPQCLVCEKNGQACEYPSAILKPGPKIGFMNLNRKRKRKNCTTGPDSEPSRETRVQRDKSSASKNGSTTDGETSSVGAENLDLETEADGMLPMTQSPRDTEDLEGRRDSLNIQDLSFHLHPSHEAPTSAKSASPCSTHNSESTKSVVITRAANALGLTPGVLETMIKIYFDNMTAINLFREPYFDQKLQSIEPSIVTHALLAAIVAFSTRFCCQEDSECDQYTEIALEQFGHAPSYFLRLASQFIDQALQEYDNSPPPLSLLQAAILVAHGQLTQGVRGNAWRSLGTCVRIAYELNLHLIDSGYIPETVEVDVEQWCDREEKRRSWWAIWEMDVFASTIRRCPTAIDWSQNETLLPVEDESWFRGQPKASCFLEQDLTRRWNVIQRSGNHSAKAWFIVINSLMKDAQCISSPRSIPNLNLRSDRREAPNTCRQETIANAAVEEARQKLETLSNSVRCFVLALPASLRFRNQYLGFDARLPGQITSARQDHCGIYNIYVMTQLATLMICQYDVFGGPIRTGWARNPSNSRLTQHPQGHGVLRWPFRGNNDADTMVLDQYFEAADNILTIVHRSCDNHVKWINAFLASTIWLAAAVQLVRKEFGPSGTNRGLVKSKFDVLYITYEKCVSCWNIQTALHQNLESLEEQLHTFHGENKRPGEARRNVMNRKVGREKESWTNEIQDRSDERHAAPGSLIQRSSNLDTSGNTLPCQFNTNDRNQSQIFQAEASYTGSTSSIANSVLQFDQENLSMAFTKPVNGQELQQQPNTINAKPISPAASILDFMRLPNEADKPVDSAIIYPDLEYMDSELFTSINQQDQPVNMEGSDNSLYIMGGDLGLSSYINELLSSGYM